MEEHETQNATMRDLLEVYRHEVNTRAEEVRVISEENDFLEIQVKNLEDDMEKAREETNASVKIAEERNTKIEKLRGVIDALKLELANEREAHTKAREAKADG